MCCVALHCSDVKYVVIVLLFATIWTTELNWLNCRVCKNVGAWRSLRGGGSEADFVAICWDLKNWFDRATFLGNLSQIYVFLGHWSRRNVFFGNLSRIDVFLGTLSWIDVFSGNSGHGYMRSWKTLTTDKCFFEKLVTDKCVFGKLVTDPLFFANSGRW